MLNSNEENLTAFIDDVSRWIRKNPDVGITIVEHNREKVVLNVRENDLSIDIPTSYTKGCKTVEMFINTETSELTHLCALNEKLCDKPRTVGWLLSHICKEKDHRSCSISLADCGRTMKINTVDMEMYELKSKLIELAKKSCSVFHTDKKHEDTVTKIFDKDTCSGVVIREYIATIPHFRDSDRVRIELIKDNIFHWRIHFKNFSNNELNKSLGTLRGLYGYDTIDVDVHFHDNLYPTYPVFVRCIRPKLNNNLMHRIPNMKIFRLEYWLPSRKMSLIIDKLWNVIDTHGSITVNTSLNDPESNPNGAYYDLESHLMKLASVSGDQIETIYESIDDEEYVMPKAPDVNSKSSSSNNKSSHWLKGTGYGHSGAAVFNASEYLRIKEEKTKQVHNVLLDIYDTLTSVTDSNRLSTMQILSESYLIPFINSTIKNATLISIEKEMDVFICTLNILSSLACEEGIFLLDSIEKESTFELLTKLQNRFSKLTIEDDKTNEIITTLNSIVEMIEPMFTNYLKIKELLKIDEFKKKKEDEKKIDDQLRLEEDYASTMEELQFDYTENIRSGHYHGSKSSKDITPALRVAIMKQWDHLAQSVPLHYESSVFIRVDPNDITLMKVMITGPHDTPYESGVHIFDVMIKPEFPSVSPAVQFINHGGNRFNPNLYAEGKVCLSILGTWGGDKGEQWMPEVSTLYQVFTSIQSLILIDIPYFNEPGYESGIGTPNGKMNSNNYNKSIRIYMMKSAMLGQLQNPNIHFRDAILTHFRLKKNRIKETLNKWETEAKDQSIFSSLKADIFTELDKLT